MSVAINGTTPTEREIVTRKRFATVPWVVETDFHASRSNRLTIRDQSPKANSCGYSQQLSPLLFMRYRKHVFPLQTAPSFPAEYTTFFHYSICISLSAFEEHLNCNTFEKLKNRDVAYHSM